MKPGERTVRNPEQGRISIKRGHKPRHIPAAAVAKEAQSFHSFQVWLTNGATCSGAIAEVISTHHVKYRRYQQPQAKRRPEPPARPSRHLYQFP